MKNSNFSFSAFKASVKNFIASLFAKRHNVTKQQSCSACMNKQLQKHEHHNLEIRTVSLDSNEQNYINPFNSTEKAKQKRTGKGRGITQYKRINFNKYFIYSKDLKPKFDAVYNAAVENAKKTLQHVYMTRVTTDSDAPVMFFVVDKINDRDILSSMRRCYIDFYNKHIGQIDQAQEAHISSKTVFKIVNN